MKKLFKSVAIVLVFSFILSFNLLACNSAAPKSESEPSSATSAETTSEKITDKEEVTTVEKSAKEKEKITFWLFLPEERMTPIIKGFTDENKDIEVAYEQIPTADYLGTKLMVAFASGEGPDVFGMNASSVTKFYDAGIAYPLDKFMTPEIKSDFLPKSLEKNTFDGQVCALPLNMDMGALFYNVDVLKAANIEPPKTLDEFRDAAIKLTTETQYGVYFPVDKSPMQVYFLSPFIWASGADIFTPDKKHSALDNENIAKILQAFKDIFDANAVILKPTTTTPILQKEVAMELSISGVCRLMKDFPDVNIGILPIPGLKSDQYATITGGWSLAANAKSKHADAAARFVVDAIGKNVDGALQFTSVLSYSPRDSVTAAGEQSFTRTPLEQGYIDKMRPIAIPELRAPGEVYSILQDMIQDALFTSTGKEAALRAHEKLEAFLLSYKGSL